MQQVVVEQFGGPEVLEVRDLEPPAPDAGEVVVRLTSIGMNHADLMGRRGDYKLSTGDPPYTPGLEGGGVIEALGDGVDARWQNRRVLLRPETPRRDHGHGGAYRSHFVCRPDEVIDAPDELHDRLLGAVWLSHFTAWGALVWMLARLGRSLEGATVALPAASSSVALAAAQVVRHHRGTAIGLTTSPEKTDDIADAYHHVVVTHDAGALKPFHRDLKALTDGKGVDVFFDPVAAGAYLNTEVRALADRGAIVVYGLLGSPGAVDVSPLIRKQAVLCGYVNDDLFRTGRDAVTAGCRHVLAGFAFGHYHQRVARTFPLADVREAHRVMEQGRHIGKLILVPGAP